MHSFHYHKGQLRCEGVDLADLAAEHDTPLYVYSAQTIQDHYRRLDAALGGLDHLICYAVKANSNLAVLDLLNQERAGFDIVSAGELYRVLHAGGRPECCTFAGVGLQRRKRSRTGDDQRGRGGRRAPCARGPAHQSGRGCRWPQVHLYG